MVRFDQNNMLIARYFYFLIILAQMKVEQSKFTNCFSAIACALFGVLRPGDTMLAVWAKR